MSVDNRKHLSSINESLRAEHNNLKSTKEHLLEHIAGLLKREKQLNKLKQELLDELMRSEHELQMEQRNKAPLCLFLKEELAQLDRKHIEDNLRIKNLENQYQLSLQDYQHVLGTVQQLLEGSSGTEGQLSRLRQSDVTMKAMIFDCERLKRVLEQEKRYFKELCNSQAKSHSERLKELQSIRKNIKEEEDSSTFSIRLSKLHLASMKLGTFFNKRILSYGETLIRGEAKENRVVKLGVKTLINCLEIGEIKMKENKRRMFSKWHNTVFPKHTLRDLAERALIIHEQSRIKLRVLGQMQTKLLSNNMSVLQLFQKMKFISALANKNSRKDKHYGFNIWRDITRKQKRISNLLQKAFLIVLPRHLQREYFKRWSKQSRMMKRIQTASILLNQFQTTKQVARVFRKWRFQVLHHEERYVREYIRRLQDQEKITRRLNYQKRKIKVLTSLHFKLTKIKLRNYFTKYWCNVNPLLRQFNSRNTAEQIQEKKEEFSMLRKKTGKEKQAFQAKDKHLLLHIFQDFIYKRKIIGAYKQWRSESQLFKKKKRSLLSLVLRKEAKNKIHVMNEFRKCVQYYQKKEMHQVLTDLNKKMEAINQKSTEFREALKNCIDNLAIIASKKLDNLTRYVENYQQREFFHTYVARKIKKAYKLILLARMLTILNLSCERQTFSSLQQHLKSSRREQEMEQKVDVILHEKKQKLIRCIFGYLKRQSMGHHQGFARMIHIENVFIFYRLSVAFAAIKRKYTAEKYKAMLKQLEQSGTLLKQREQNMANAQNARANAEQGLKQFFGRMISYEDRKQKIKVREKTHNMLRNYLTRFRKNIRGQVLREKAVQNIGDVLLNHNQYLFFRNLMIIRYDQLLAEVKQQLSKINKKRKVFEQKNGKLRQDMQRRLQQQIRVYTQCKEYLNFYQKRFQNLVRYYAARTRQNDENYLKRQIFLMWKYEYVATKRVFKAIERVYNRRFLKDPKDVIMKELKSREQKTQAQLLILDILSRKGQRQIKKAMHLWRANIYKYKLWEIEVRLSHLDDYQDQMKEQIKERRYLIGNQTSRVNFKQLKTTVFMAFKQVWQEVKTNRRKVKPLQQKRAQRNVRDAMDRWKWLIFYKHTKRSYLKYTKDKYENELKKDVFNALKFYRQSIYTLVGRAKAASNLKIFKLSLWAFDKIRNQADQNRNQLDYQRKRALFTLIGTKISRIQIIKRKILYKWNSWLIPRTHYLPSIMKRIELNRIKSAFANINQKKYWNDYYIRNIAEEVTSQGYNQINGITNSLMRQGYDPDEIKDYLKKRNDKDSGIIDRVVKHLRTWAKKEDVVRAFHSWKQYCGLKKKIKNALVKVFNIAGGIGKYWTRWRSKDPHFNEVLKKQSRGNMLNRYRELSRLLKQYHRDIRDNSSNLTQLQAINSEYKQKNKMGILMALNTCSNSIKKGIRQGFLIWNERLHEHKRILAEQRQEQIIRGIQLLKDQRGKIRYKIGVLREQNKQLKEKCMWGVECGKILERLLTQKDSLSIDLADKEHNLKLLLQDNLRLKQKVKLAKNNAEKLIRKVQQQRE